MAAVIQPVADQRVFRTVADPVTQTTSPSFRLPIELRIEIVNYLSRPKDIKALCLTSKEICEIATPRLYHKVDLIVPGDHYDTLWTKQENKLLGKISSLLSAPSNLRFIRILNTGPFSKRTTVAMDALLPHLRLNALIKFNFSTSSKDLLPTGRQLQFLWYRQRKLQNLQLCTEHIPFLMEFLKAAQQPVSCLTKFVTSLKLANQAWELGEETDTMLLPFTFVDMSRLQCLSLTGPIPLKVVAGLNRLFANRSFVNLTELHINQATCETSLELRNLPYLGGLSFGGAWGRYRYDIEDMPISLQAKFPLRNFTLVWCQSCIPHHA